MSEGVEWAAHVCILLHWLGDRPVPADKLAAAYDLPPAYLGKQLQALRRAGITESAPGRAGGVRLARPADKVTLLDVVVAIEGADDAFACTEIRQRGLNADRPASSFTEPCGIAHAMRAAELQWRRHLAATTIAGLAADTPTEAAEKARAWFAT